MTRLDPATEAYLGLPHIDEVFAVRLDLQPIPVLLHSDIGPMVLHGETYEGVGSLGEITNFREDTSRRPHGVRLRLRADDTLISSVMTHAPQWRDARVEIFYVILDNGDPVTTEPPVIWRARVAGVNIIQSSQGDAVEIATESNLTDWDRVPGGLFSDEWFRIFYPNDGFFKQVGELSRQNLSWGGRTLTNFHDPVITGGGRKPGGRGGIGDP
ncbi:MAG: hypothetical protein QNK37_20665 [Acidobacteriota bacterium]|nr:hypothetical protein [Acidobacteriota bacterium]